MTLESDLHKAYPKNGLSKEAYLDGINSIIDEAPDLFEALQKDHFE